ncbi:MAG TPA: hypothetical protein VLA37_09700 [Sphingomonadaceae bacterium]|nr:hypothetical protein [Sphingomonadaceae bacterium]
MLRKLFTLLAIVSGLTAMAAPAEARIAALADARVELASQGVAKCRVYQAELGKKSATSKAKPRSAVLRCSLRAVVLQVPTVQLGVDRARE